MERRGRVVNRRRVRENAGETGPPTLGRWNSRSPGAVQISRLFAFFAENLIPPPG